MGILDIISRLVLDGNYIFREHIEDKLSEINYRRSLYLTTDDVLSVLLTGYLVEVLDNDERGRRYLINGTALDNLTELEIVCRIEGNLIIITVYETYF